MGARSASGNQGDHMDGFGLTALTMSCPVTLVLLYAVGLYFTYAKDTLIADNVAHDLVRSALLARRCTGCCR